MVVERKGCGKRGEEKREERGGREEKGRREEIKGDDGSKVEGREQRIDWEREKKTEDGVKAEEGRKCSS